MTMQYYIILRAEQIDQLWGERLLSCVNGWESKTEFYVNATKVGVPKKNFSFFTPTQMASKRFNWKVIPSNIISKTNTPIKHG